VRFEVALLGGNRMAIRLGLAWMLLSFLGCGNPYDPAELTYLLDNMFTVAYGTRERLQGGRTLEEALSLYQGPMLSDPWGEPLVVDVIDDRVRVRSKGPDQKLGTADDITTIWPE
jgi:hypothetical protein